MSEQQPEEPDLTAGGIVFGDWSTAVENDDLTLVSVGYVYAKSVEFPDFTLQCSATLDLEEDVLEALFLSRQKRTTVRFRFDGVRAFRVLDEAGLVDIWHASSETARPARTTFRVRGHGWQSESFLEWIMAAGPEHFSYMVATSFSCLEVVGCDEPVVTIEPAIMSFNG